MIDGKDKAIVVIDDVITSQDCLDLIKYFNIREDQIRNRDHIGMDFYPIVAYDSGLAFDDFSKQMVSKVFRYLGNSIRPNRSHIEMRQIGSEHPMHFDITNESTVFTSVTYLNDDFTGGETVIRPHGESSNNYDTVIKPKAGRTVFYDGTHFLHGVYKVYNSVRYTMPIWYSYVPEDFPDKRKWWK